MYSPNPREHSFCWQKDEITFTKCSVPAQSDKFSVSPPSIPLERTCIQRLSLEYLHREGQVYLAGDTTNQFSANLVHKGYAQISRQSLSLSLICFIIEFAAKMYVPLLH